MAGTFEHSDKKTGALPVVDMSGECVTKKEPTANSQRRFFVFKFEGAHGMNVCLCNVQKVQRNTPTFSKL